MAVQGASASKQNQIVSKWSRPYPLVLRWSQLFGFQGVLSSKSASGQLCSAFRRPGFRKAYNAILGLVYLLQLISFCTNAIPRKLDKTQAPALMYVKFGNSLCDITDSMVSLVIVILTFKFASKLQLVTLQKVEVDETLTALEVPGSLQKRLIQDICLLMVNILVHILVHIHRLIQKYKDFNGWIVIFYTFVNLNIATQMILLCAYILDATVRFEGINAGIDK